MKLLKLSIANFKGIRKLVLDTQGGSNVNIYADNALGKTSIYDAFLWLLFDKDSQNKKDFSIKTLDAHGNEIHNIDHEVEGIFEIDGKKLTLRKVYAEKWTQKKGSPTATFTGHTTDYFIDGVSVKKKEYIDTIAQIASEDIFKLLTSPSYFNTQLHWQDRRSILLEVCGDLTDEEVIASDKSLAELPNILQGRQLDKHREVIKSRQAKINDELKKIPVRIDETTKGLPEIDSIDIGLISPKIADLKNRVKGKNEQIARIKNGGEVAEKTKALRELEGQIQGIMNKHREQMDNKVQGKKVELSKARDGAEECQRSIQDKERSIKGNENLIAEATDKAAKYRDKWYEINGLVFEYSQECTCPACGQSLPEKRLAEAREKALAAFNLNKAEKLAETIKAGKGYTETAKKLKEANAALETALADEKEKFVIAVKKVADLKADIEDIRSSMTDVTTDSEYIKCIEKMELLKKQITELEAGNDGQVVGIKAEIAMLESEIGELEKSLAQVDQYKKGKKRIKDLEVEQKVLAAEFENLEKQLYLTEEFIRSKVKLLEERINSRFKLARFKLFDVQVNGGVVECCETIFQGVPYSSGLNNAARINVGLDIINTLSEHYNFVAPIFVDNAEAVVELNPTKGQMIKLIVSGTDKKLRVELENKETLREAV